MDWELRGERVTLRPVLAADEAAMIAVWGDAAVARWMGDFGPRTPDQVRAWVRDRAGDLFPPQPTGSVNVAITRWHEVIGWIGAGGPAAEPGRGWDFGYALHPDHRGHGYMADALRLLRDYALTVLGVPVFWGTCDPANQASAHTMVNAGLVEVGVDHRGERLFERRC